MRSWVSVFVLFATAALVLGVRRSFRVGVTAWMAPRLGATTRSGRAATLRWQLPAFVGAVALVTGGFLAQRSGGSWPWLAYPAAIVVLLGYVPFTSLGSPRLTRWQKSFGQRLLEAGAVREAALAAETVARVFSVLGLLVGVAAFFLVAHHVA